MRGPFGPQRPNVGQQQMQNPFALGNPNAFQPQQMPNISPNQAPTQRTTDDQQK